MTDILEQAHSENIIFVCCTNKKEERDSSVHYEFKRGIEVVWDDSQHT